MNRRALLLLTGCASLVGCDPGPTPEPPPTPAPTVERSCTPSVDAVADPPAGYRVVVDEVAVPADRVLQVADSAATGAAAGRFAKWGLLVRAGSTAEVAVAPGWEERVRVEWGQPGRPPGSSVRVVACGADNKWIAFVGGTWVTQPACVPLVIRAGGREETVELGVGTPCS